MKGHLTPFARNALKGTAVALDRFGHRQPGVTILIYHRVGLGAGGQMDLTTEDFEAQLGWLKTNRRIISLDEAVGLLDTSRRLPETVAGLLPEQCVVITFDDGTTDWVDHVLPALERHDAPATFYVATSFVEERIELPGGGEPVTWKGLREMTSSPLVTIGAHTHRHMLLDRLAESEIADELDRCTDLLGERIGIDAKHFAYPKAVAGSPSAEEAVRSRFESAVLAGTRANPVGTDLHRLHRSPVQASDAPRHFRLKASGGMRAEDDLRNLANRVRYRKLAS